MKVSEKSLELNVGAEILNLLRWHWGKPKAYLRGLTQREESQEGADFFAHLPASTRIYAFQFKAPKRGVEDVPYGFTVQRRQHEKLAALAAMGHGGVYYVLPFYVGRSKLAADVPHLLQDTWLLPVGGMSATDVFGLYQSRTMRCWRGHVSVNPDYVTKRGFEMERDPGIPVRRFERWYAGLRDDREVTLEGRRGRGNPWLVRGLRVAVAPGVDPRDD